MGNYHIKKQFVSLCGLYTHTIGFELDVLILYLCWATPWEKNPVLLYWFFFFLPLINDGIISRRWHLTVLFPNFKTHTHLKHGKLETYPFQFDVVPVVTLDYFPIPVIKTNFQPKHTQNKKQKGKS